MIESILASILNRALDLWPWIWPNKAKRKRKALLEKLLRDERFPKGRSFEELQRKTGMTKTPQACRNLLSEIGAEGIKLHDGREGWRLSVLVFVILGPGCLVSHYGAAIVQNSGRPSRLVLLSSELYD